MKFDAKRAAQRGILMIDAIVYIVVLGIVLILAASIFDKGMRESTALQRNAADIERALKAGERWRADVHLATGPIQQRGSTFIVPQKVGEVVYEIGTNQVRRTGLSQRPEIFLAQVKDSKMVEERRDNIVGWRWELELERRLKETRVRPLFTFIAVPGGAR